MQAIYLNCPKRFLAILVILSLGFLIYSNTLYYPFQYDDEPSITKNISIRHLHNLKAIWDFCPLRFITYLSFALNYRLHELNIFGYHLTNILIHLISAGLVFWLLSLTFLTPIGKKEKISQYGRLIAFFAALVFLAHPVQTQAITYIVQRTASLAALFYIASLSFYIKTRLLQNTHQASHWRLYYFVSLFCALLGMFTKEITFSLPLTILLYEFCFFRQDKHFNLRHSLVFFMFLIIPALVIHFNKILNLQYKLAEPLPLHNYVFTQFRVLVTYLRLFFLPLNQNLLYDYPISQSLWELPTLASLCLLILIFSIGIKLFSRYRLLSFGIFWFFLALSVESSVIPIKDVIFEHRLYLPMLGFSLFLSAGLFLILTSRCRLTLIITLLSGLIAVCSTLTYKRNFVWKDELTLWNDAVSKSPNNARSLNNRGKFYLKKQEYDKAFFDFNQAIKLNPNFATAYNNRGNAYFYKNEYERALFDYNRALTINPLLEDAYYNRGNLYFHRGELSAAILDYNQAITINPKYAAAYYNRAEVYRSKAEFGKAISDYTQAISIYADAYNNRGLVYAMQKEYSKAISDYTSALKINPKLIQAYNNRATVFAIEGDYIKAIADYDEALKISPDFLEASKNRETALNHAKSNPD